MRMSNEQRIPGQGILTQYFHPLHLLSRSFPADLRQPQCKTKSQAVLVLQGKEQRAHAFENVPESFVLLQVSDSYVTHQILLYLQKDLLISTLHVSCKLCHPRLTSSSPPAKIKIKLLYSPFLPMECVFLAVQCRKHSISHFLWVFSCHRKVYFEQLRERGHFTPKSSFPTVMLFNSPELSGVLF